MALGIIIAALIFGAFVDNGLSNIANAIREKR
jgi:hypothetical protein